MPSMIDELQKRISTLEEGKDVFLIGVSGVVILLLLLFRPISKYGGEIVATIWLVIVLLLVLASIVVAILAKGKDSIRVVILDEFILVPSLIFLTFGMFDVVTMGLSTLVLIHIGMLIATPRSITLIEKESVETT